MRTQGEFLGVLVFLALEDIIYLITHLLFICHQASILSSCVMFCST